MINIIDLKFQGFSRAIASFLLESSAGPILVETGPHSTIKTLEKSVNDYGYELSDIKNVLLSHIHFDHAGAAWALAQKGAKIYLHPKGAQHLAQPARLYESAKRIYKDKMDTLWGRMESIRKDHLFRIPNNSVVRIGDLVFKAHHTPGHATHHIAWQLDDILFTGDVAGVKVNEGPVVPPCPPPDINIEEWKASISLIRSLNISGMYLTHFGHFPEVDKHLDQLEKCLEEWSQWIKKKWEEGLTNPEITPLFQEFVGRQLLESGLTESEISRYESANPSWMSVAGLVRYWTKKLERA